MKAIVKTERKPGNVEILEVEEPKIKEDDDVIVEIKSCAVCGSDLHAYEYPPSYEFMKVPVILGHEYSGIVKEVGSKVTDFKPGDRVMGESNQYCGKCSNCKTGKTNICLNSKMTGLMIDGSLAEYIKTKERYLHKIPEKLSFEEAAMAQPCAVSDHAVVDNTKIKPGDTVVVFGPGIVGLVAAQIVRVLGAKDVVIVGTDVDMELRIPIAQSLGFKTINVQQSDLSSELLNLTGRQKADVVIECSGANKALQDAATIVRKGGAITLVGIYNKPVEFPFTNLVRNEVVIRTSYTCKWDNYENVLMMLENKSVDLKPLYKIYPFKEAIKAFEDGLNKKVLKPVIRI
ncbi:MAG: L-iditol 2-dehydrogenase [Thermosediminibacterales bacterium]|nr:L-iditol 2-dehydrogenase [Thermosediminibacterales bacterium]MDK2835304.1 L-iditol 2-dehydrogenase [Thermosediminibacterales bacterium]